MNLTGAVAAGGELASLVKALRMREEERERLKHQLVAAHHAEKQTQVNPSRLREQMMEKFADWRRVLQRQTPMARQMVKKLLDGPLKFTAKDGYYEFRGRGDVRQDVGE